MANICTIKASFARPLEMSAERSEAKQTAWLAMRSHQEFDTPRRFEAELR